MIDIPGCSPYVDANGRLHWWPFVIASPEIVQAVLFGPEAVNAMIGDDRYGPDEDICALVIDGKAWPRDITSADTERLLASWRWGARK